MECKRIFDTIPEEFDRWRPRYCTEAFDCIINHAKLDSKKSVLEIGPGTGQATEPILKTNCNYLAIELGEHLAEFTKNRFKSYSNFHIVNADFETYDFGQQKFDLIFSAAAMQWIPEKTAFEKSYDLLKSGGILAMMLMHGDYKSPNEALYREIQKVYAEYFHPEISYTQKLEYQNVMNYGFKDYKQFEFTSRREFSADDYVKYLGTHCDHIVLKETCKSQFYDGIRKSIRKYGNKIEFKDTIILYLASKRDIPKFGKE